jgi:hypothetical protein
MESSRLLAGAHMARFHFHLWDGKSLIPDLEGSELPNVDAVKARSEFIARELLAEEVLQGRLPLNMRLDVMDSEEQTIFRLSFGDAVEILI